MVDQVIEQENKVAFDRAPGSNSPEKAQAFTSETKLQTEAIGSSGTEIYGGYFTEEYLNNLRGPDASALWDKMRRSETQIAMVLSAIYNSIKSATWEIKAYKEDPNYVAQAEFIKFNLFEGIDFEQFKTEALTFIHQGFAPFEVVHNVVLNHPRFGTFNGLASLAFRSQKTIQAWNLEKKTGKIKNIEQWGQGDVAERVNIPGEFLIVFTNQKEGDNYEGISALRPMYGAYSRKQTYLKLTAIGVEKYAIGTPVGTVPANKENSEDFKQFKAVLKAFTSHEQAYITRPEGWDIEIIYNQFDSSKIVDLLQFENTEMINAVVANFLALGTNGGGGAFALSNDLSDFFSNGLQAYANIISNGINRCLIPNLVKLNFGQQDGYPQLQISGISDKAGKELAEILGTLADKKYIKPDMPLEEFLRRQFKLPKADEKTARDTDPAPAGPFNNVTQKFSEKSGDSEFKKQVDAGHDEVKALMQTHLKEMANALKKKLKIKDATEVSIPPEMILDYENALREALGKQAAIAYKGAVKKVPVKTKKLSEYLDSIKLATPGVGFYAALPESIRKIVETQAGLLAESQPADITKIVKFQFTSSSSGTDDEKQIDKDSDEAVDKTLQGSNARGMSVDAAAGDSVAFVSNQARTEHFFAPEVLDQIESFTFENNDPVSEICQELAGKTFAVNDPRVDEYNPPLHHNAVITGTLIETNDGLVPIEKLSKGDIVRTHTGKFKPITEWMDRFEDKDYFEMVLENGKTLNVTGEHPVLTSRGWVRVDGLTLEDNIVCVEDVL